MQREDFDSTDVTATEDFLVRAYTKMRIGSSTEQFRAKVSRSVIGRISLDRHAIGFDMAYDAEALGTVCLCVVESGRITEQETDGWTDDFGPGDVVSFAPHDRPSSGTVRDSRYTITMFDPALLTTVADTPPGGRIELRNHRPVSTQAGRQLRSTIDYLDRLAAESPEVTAEPLIVSSTEQLLAASVVNTFGLITDAGPDDPAGRPATVRKAIAFIESRPESEITLTEIAAAAQVTVRAVQLAFRRNLDTTPMAYLRRVRLAEAHRQLGAADPATSSVTAIAARWGFHHPGRFAAQYRQAYGMAPSQALHA